ncbi:MAG: type II toxin-antitoxin system VapC family toxin [Alphaproteobacteria bacterium]
MSGYVVDASVAVKWLVTEPNSDQAEHLLGCGLTLVAPALLFAEAANALWAICRRGYIGRNEFAEALGVLKSAPIDVPVPMRDLAASAGRLAVDLDHPVYDCFYLALALQEQHPVVTADQRFYGRVCKHPYLSDRVVHLEGVNLN